MCSSWAGHASMTQLKPWTPADKSPRFPHYNVIFCDQIFDSILIAFFFQKFLRPWGNFVASLISPMVFGINPKFSPFHSNGCWKVRVECHQVVVMYVSPFVPLNTQLMPWHGTCPIDQRAVAHDQLVTTATENNYHKMSIHWIESGNYYVNWVIRRSQLVSNTCTMTGIKVK